MKDVTYSSISELSTLLQTKQVSSVELAQHFLDRIEKYAHLNAFLDVRPEETLPKLARQMNALPMEQLGYLRVFLWHIKIFS